jgi:hypothetical protein
VACDLHFSPVHWTAKPGKAEGRFLCDLSNSEEYHVLNDEAAKAFIEARYGSVTLPSIRDIVDKIYLCAESAGGMKHVRLWKEDVVAAFNQFNFSPASARRLAFHIGDNTVLILFTGNFGWQGSPAVWAVFSRALLRAAEGRLSGLIVVYVDDFIGISVASRAHVDQAILRELVFGVFGPSAINILKSVLPSQVTDCIGWTVDLINEIIYPNEKGRRKLVAVFFGFDINGLIGQHTFERMASLASRYSEALVGTRPFVTALYAAATRGSSRHASSETRACIVVWRAISLMAWSNPLSLAVPLLWGSSSVLTPRYIPTSDAGPKGLGVVVRNPAGVVLAYVSYRLPFSDDGSHLAEAKESRFQNVREFLGAIMSMIICFQLAGGGMCYSLD